MSNASAEMSIDRRPNAEEKEEEAQKTLTLELTNSKDKLKKRKRDLKLIYDEGDCCVTAIDRDYKRIILLLTKPSYSLAGGVTNLRDANRSRLRNLLCQLVNQHDWIDAIGVLAVLLKGTCKDKCPTANRFKYTVLVKLLKHCESKIFGLPSTSVVYDIWMSRIGINISNRRKRNCANKEDIFAVRLESILSRLMQGDVEGECLNARSLMQEQEFENHPVFSSLIGMIFYEIWYFSIPEEMKWKSLKQIDTATHSENSASSSKLHISDRRDSYSVGESERDVVVYDHQSVSLDYSSETSVRNDKRISANNSKYIMQVTSLKSDALQRHVAEDFQQRGFYADSAENEALVDDKDFINSVANLSSLRHFDSWVLPLQIETWEPDRIIYNEDYQNAVDYLRKAVHSTPPVVASVLPLIQLLLLGGRDLEALKELENVCSSSASALPFRLRAYLLEQIDPNNSSVLSTCLENSLKTDPTCRYSLERLVVLHKRGDYGPEPLLEMIALHLDAVFAEYVVWREFASCFLKVFHSEEDRLSVCLNSDEGRKKEPYSVRYNKLPKMFADRKQQKAWGVRCRWWSTRHFSQSTLASEIGTGDLELVAYKAACAYHMYGQNSKYFLRAYSCLEEGNNGELKNCLRDHMKNSVCLSLCLQRSL